MSLPCSVASAAEYSVTDYADDSLYSVSVDGSLVSIQGSGKSAEFYADDSIISCCVFDGMFSFMCYRKDDKNNTTTVFRYDINSGKLEYSSFTFRAVYSETAFAATKYGYFYFVSSSDNAIAYCYTKSGAQYSVNCGSRIRQLLCIDGVNVIAITTNGIFLIKSDSAQMINSERPSVPCQYVGGGIVTDNIGTEYRYNNGKLEAIQEISTPVPTVSNSDKSASVTAQTEDIKISGDNLYVFPGITVAKLRTFLGVDKDSLKVTDNGKQVSSGKLGTGMVAVYNNKQYYLVVSGDLTGEGNVNSRDLKLIMKYLTEEDKPDNVHSMAADINSDNVINTKDMLALANMY